MCFCYHTTQFFMTCLHGKTLGVRIIVAPTVLLCPIQKMKHTKYFLLICSSLLTMSVSRDNTNIKPLTGLFKHKPVSTPPGACSHSDKSFCNGHHYLVSVADRVEWTDRLIHSQTNNKTKEMTWHTM